MNLGLIVSMYDEEESVVKTLANVGECFERVVVIQSDLVPYPRVAEMIDSHPDAQYILFPNTDTRTEEQRAASSERFDYLAKGIRRNFCEGFRLMMGADVDYVVVAYGDTLILHPYGLEYIIEHMGTAKVACSRAMGQQFHSSEWTREQMSDPDCPKEGRLQDDTNKDFMPHLWIVTADMIDRLTSWEITNPWCLEQVVGDAIGDAEQYVFSETAYGFTDGVIYNTPSPAGWKHTP